MQPMLAASSGPRPSYTLFRSYPNIGVGHFTTKDETVRNGHQPSCFPPYGRAYPYMASAYCRRVLLFQVSLPDGLPFHHPILLYVSFFLDISDTHNVCNRHLPPLHLLQLHNLYEHRVFFVAFCCLSRYCWNLPVHRTDDCCLPPVEIRLSCPSPS